jgi:subtilase family serine protease
MNRSRMSLCAVTALALVTAGAIAAPANANANRRRVPRTAPAWVADAHAKGRASGKATSTFRVYLAPKGGVDALKAAVAKVSDPSSATYGSFMDASRYHATYDAPTASVKQVRSWLKDNGLRVGSVEKHHRYLAVSGSNANVEKAFATTMKTFAHAGTTVQANTTNVSVPATIAPLVLTVTGLDTTPSKVTHNATPQAPPPAGFRNARPCSTAYGQLLASKEADFKTPLPTLNGKTLPYSVCGYTGPQYRAAYQGANPEGLSGAGVTVAITDAYAAPTIAKDAQTYATNHGDGSYAAGQLSQVTPSKYTNQAACDPSGWYGEETLDVEAVHAMAPGANIRYYASASCQDSDFLATLGKVVDENKASIVSNSWSDLEANETTDSIAAYEQVFLQGAMQGISFLFSSGDNGDEVASSGLKQTDYPASDPYATAVGGTADAIGANGAFIFQTGWGTDKYSLSADAKSWNPLGYLYGAGGGNSSLFNQPSYQAGVVPAAHGSGRATPDVGLDADPTTGMLIGETQTFPEGKAYGEYRIGGTSLASPLFAGMTALLQQHAKGRVGFLNPTIYKQAGTPVFTDVKGAPKDAGNVRVDYTNGLDATGGLLYSIRTFNQDASLSTAKGWDDVTGVGSPNSGWITSVPAK